MREEADLRLLRRFHGQISVGLHQLIDNLQHAMSTSSRDTIENSVRSLASFMGKTHGDAGPLDDDAVYRQLTSSRRGLLDSLRQQAIHRLRPALADQVWRRVSEMAASGKHTIGDLVHAAADELDAQWWRIERTARTESSYAFNLGQAEGVAELAKHHPGMLQRWTELVDDATGAPMDNRVGMDSIVMHGQVAAPGGRFSMPADPRAPTSLIGLSWTHPPNRPNDRAVLTPWMRGWPVPAWQYRGGRRVQLR